MNPTTVRISWIENGTERVEAFEAYIFPESARVAEFNSMSTYDGDKVDTEFVIKGQYLTISPAKNSIQLMDEHTGIAYDPIRITPVTAFGQSVTTIMALQRAFR